MKPYYQDERVTLYHGDCLELADLWTCADVLVTDPPYGMAYRDRLGKHEAIHGDDDTAVRDRAIELWGGESPMLVFGSWRVERPTGLRNLLIWDKGTDLGMGVSTPWGLSHEEVYVLGTWPALTPGGRVREGGVPCRVPSVIRAAKPNNASASRVLDHPTPKPVALMETLIYRCPPGTIADPFAGSGSTGVAAKALGRKAVLVELEERYCEIAARRLSQDVLNFEEVPA